MVRGHRELKWLQTEHVPLKETVLGFNKVEKCLLLPLLGQRLSSSLEAFPSFPGGAQPASKLPGIWSSLHNAGAAHVPCCLEGNMEGSCVSHRPCLTTQELSLEGRSGSYSPPGYCQTLEVTVERPGVYKWSPSMLNHVDRAFEDTVGHKERL